jgi:carbon-monoxide dehydrogenase medium subunit
MRPFRYYRPSTVDEALAILTDHGDRAAALAGGTKLVPWLKDGVVDYQVLVSLRYIEALRGVRDTGEHLEIGAMTTLAELDRDPTIARDGRLLRAAIANLHVVQLRERSTIGGELASARRQPAVPSLLDAPLRALGAELRIVSVAGTVVVALDRAFAEASPAGARLIAAVRIPRG